MESEDLMEVNKLLSNPKALNRIDFRKFKGKKLNGETILTFACLKGGLAVVLTILAHSPASDEQLNRDGATPLFVGSIEKNSIGYSAS